MAHLLRTWKLLLSSPGAYVKILATCVQKYRILASYNNKLHTNLYIFATIMLKFVNKIRFLGAYLRMRQASLLPTFQLPSKAFELNHFGYRTGLWKLAKSWSRPKHCRVQTGKEYCPWSHWEQTNDLQMSDGPKLQRLWEDWHGLSSNGSSPWQSKRRG